MSEKCETCKWHSSDGYCHNPKQESPGMPPGISIFENERLSSQFDISCFFGCVHHELSPLGELRVWTEEPPEWVFTENAYGWVIDQGVPSVVRAFPMDEFDGVQSVILHRSGTDIFMNHDEAELYGPEIKPPQMPEGSDEA